MRSYWLAPVLMEDESALLSSERFALTPPETRERFLQLMKQVNPRLLVPFKSNLLLSEESEIRCGVDQLPFQLESEEQFVFSPDMLELSHCAQAYIDKRPIGAEMSLLLQQAFELLGSEASDEPIAGWLHKMKKWNEQGYTILLLS
ncbi:hypothetical protein [Paenibacillus sp. UNC451MF]|uniref:hypothetical protein n=1 Tax=Paenibacillus sp. UNC451MF TaxID=1449063 RepID=UPI00048BBD6C|nr:hypothetical protein [Paenibacillus sp. UNC451MF]